MGEHYRGRPGALLLDLAGLCFLGVVLWTALVVGADLDQAAETATIGCAR